MSKPQNIVHDNKDIIVYFEKIDPIMAETVAMYISSPKREIIKASKASQYNTNLYRSIISQQLSVKAAATIWARFEGLVKNPQNPEIILNITDEELRSIGLSRQKISYIKGIALAVAQNKLDIKHIDQLTNDEVIAKLTALKGIGVWSAEMFLIFSLARPDVFSVGDLGLRNAISRLYEIDAKDLQKIEKLSKNWSPHRSICSLALWHSLDNK